MAWHGMVVVVGSNCHIKTESAPVRQTTINYRNENVCHWNLNFAILCEIIIRRARASAFAQTKKKSFNWIIDEIANPKKHKPAHPLPTDGMEEKPKWRFGAMGSCCMQTKTDTHTHRKKFFIVSAESVHFIYGECVDQCAMLIMKATRSHTHR